MSAEIGAIVPGTVVRIAPYGPSSSSSRARQALVHISEIDRTSSARSRSTCASTTPSRSRSSASRRTARSTSRSSRPPPTGSPRRAGPAAPPRTPSSSRSSSGSCVPARNGWSTSSGSARAGAGNRCPAPDPVPGPARPHRLPDPKRLPWHPAGTPDPRAEAGWAAALPEAGAAERRLIEAQIGRDVRGSVAVASRCRYGLRWWSDRAAAARRHPVPDPVLAGLPGGQGGGRPPGGGRMERRAQRAGGRRARTGRRHAAAHAGYLAQRDAMAPSPATQASAASRQGPAPPRPLRPPVRHRRQPGRPHRQPGRRPHRLPGSCASTSTRRGSVRSLGGEIRLATAGTETVAGRARRRYQLDPLLVADVAAGAIVAEHAREMVITGSARASTAPAASTRRRWPAPWRCSRLRRHLPATRRGAPPSGGDQCHQGRRRPPGALDGVRDLLGVEPEVLTGQAEAAAAYRGATAGLDGDQPTLVVDIGGGSTELIPRLFEAGPSLPDICVRLFERHLHGDPPTAAEVAALRADVAAHLARVAGVLDPAAASRVVGVAARSPPSPRSRWGSTPTTRAASTGPPWTRPRSPPPPTSWPR